MKTTPLMKLSIGLIALALAVAGTWIISNAQADQTPNDQISPIHPAFALLDQNKQNVLTTNDAVSTINTCGQCHNTDYITQHSFHSDLGLSDLAAPTEGWNLSSGLFGEFDPITYRYLSPAGDERIDLTTPEWIMINGARIAGGGPGTTSRDGRSLTAIKADAKNPEAGIIDPKTGKAKAWDWSKSGTLEMNCYLCHTVNPNNAERISTISAGEFENATTATLIGSGIVEPSGEGWLYNPEAFSENGELKPDFVKIQDPTNDNCAQCHGEIHSGDEPLLLEACDTTQTQTSTTGQVVSSQKISKSGLNLADKASLNFAWDIHAERALKCTDCHYSINNPVHAQEARGTMPAHLTYDPRKLELGEYLEKPDHNFARGASAQFNVSPETKGTMRRCESCHDSVSAHEDWLPYADRHMAVVACETCHIPQMHTPAIQAIDWTVITTDGTGTTTCRGIEGPDTITDLVTGYSPALMQRTNVDGHTLLAPYNLITAWFWTYEDANGNVRPVRRIDLEAAYLINGRYAAEIVTAFDQDQDGAISSSELKIDSQAKQDAVMARLESLGLKNVKINGQIQPYSINHNVVAGEYALGDCQACHNADSAVNRPMQLAEVIPGGVTPAFVTENNVSATGSIYTENGALYYQPATSEDGLYVFGHNRVNWIDWLGSLIFLGTVLGVGGHGTMRYLASRKQPKTEKHLKAVPMYDAYERIWHWLQTLAIVILLATGLIIHRPDLFGAFSFRYMVTIHNVLAALLAINAALSLFWHLTSGEIHQYIPHPRGFVDEAFDQIAFYIKGIFKGEKHPFEKTKEKKLNPLQKVTYFGLLNVLLPLQGITGIIMWGVQKFPGWENLFGGLPVLAPFHSLIAWLFATFIVAHVYLTTTGATVFEDIKAMITGWENVEVHE